MNLGRTAAILPGGGATGALQAGFFEATDELGIHFEEILAVSCGALNAAQNISSGSKALKDAWLRVEKRGAGRIFSQIHLFTHVVGPWKGPALYSDTGLRELVNELDMEKIINSPIKLHIIVRNRSQNKIERKINHDFRNVPNGQEIYRQTIKASACFQGLFPAQKIGGVKYSDGRIITTDPFIDFDTVIVFTNNLLKDKNVDDTELPWDEQLMECISSLIGESIETELEYLEEAHNFHRFSSPQEELPSRPVHHHILQFFKGAVRSLAGLPSNKKLIVINPIELIPTLRYTSFRYGDISKAIQHGYEVTKAVLKQIE